MKKKTTLLGLLATTLLLSTLFIFEYLVPDNQTASSYFVKMKSSGEPVKKSQFKGYKYTETVYNSRGHSSKLSFYSDKKLAQNERFKIIVNSNHFVSNYKKVSTLPKNVQYLAEK
ncbi:YxeA family protein [Listeria aquatica]|uniref:YxeA family protein n=1 Tax=Listeria aquatica TaxID=1494960 RepID=UPI0031F489D8